MRRRKNMTWLSILAVVALVAAGCSDDPGEREPTATERNAAKPEGSGNAKCERVAIAYVGTVVGDNAAFGRDIHAGVEFAILRHNDANPDCQVDLVEYNTEGDPAKVPGIVAGLAAREDVVGVVGLPFSDESARAGGTLAKHDLVQITPSATDTQLAAKGWKTFFRGTASGAAQAEAAATFMTGKLKKRRICVVREDSTYGRDLGAEVTRSLGEKAVCDVSFKVGQEDFAPMVKEVVAAKPDAVFFAGDHRAAAPFARDLAAAAKDVRLVASDRAKAPEFVDAAGKAGASTYFTCPCAPAERLAEFSASFAEKMDREPGSYTAEAYDATTVLLKGIDAGNADRKVLLSYVAKYKGQALSNVLEWNADGELVKPSVRIYRVSGDRIVPDSEAG